MPDEACLEVHPLSCFLHAKGFSCRSRKDVVSAPRLQGNSKPPASCSSLCDSAAKGGTRDRACPSAMQAVVGQLPVFSGLSCRALPVQRVSISSQAARPGTCRV